MKPWEAEKAVPFPPQVTHVTGECVRWSVLCMDAPPVSGEVLPAPTRQRRHQVTMQGVMWMRQLVILSREWKTRLLRKVKTAHRRGPLLTANTTWKSKGDDGKA
jgi:hypothetical protein